jgi:hypothetical protein
MLVVHSPTGRLDRQAQRFIHEKQDWILKHLARQNQALQKRQAFLARLERRAYYQGRELPVDCYPARGYECKIRPDRLAIYAPREQLAAPKSLIKASLWHLGQQYLEERLQYWARRCELSYNQVRVKDVKTRWGSCSSKQNINLNWHLIMLPPQLTDYVLVHELMHLRELNHSPAFWRWVEAYCPHWQSARDEIRHYQWLLGIYD